MTKSDQKNRWKWPVALLLLGAAGAAGIWYWKISAQQPPRYLTSVAMRGDLVQVVTASGTVNPVTTVQVGSQISGNIQTLLVDFNSPVRAGQVVAKLDPATYEANVRQTAADVASAKASVEWAQINAHRAEELAKKSLITQSEYDKTVADLHQAEALVIQREATLDKAKVDLGRCTIYSPIDGLVISRHVDVGQTVTASLSAPTFYMIAGDLTQMQIDANVAEADIGGIEEGQDVEFTVDAFPTRVFKGKVLQIRFAPTTLQNVVTYDTVIQVDNRQLKLKPGMTANVAIIVARKQNVVKIPNAALRFRAPDVARAGDSNSGGLLVQNQKPRTSSGAARAGGSNPAATIARARHPHRTIYTLASTNGNARGANVLSSVQVKPGITDGIFTEVVEGLAEGTVVVTGLSAPQGATTASVAGSNPFGVGTSAKRN